MGYPNLNIRINIDPKILGRKKAMAETMLKAVENGIPFVLKGENAKCIVIPDKLAVVQYSNGVERCREVAKDERAFYNILKICMVGYDSCQPVHVNRQVVENNFGQ